jgi:hypothetical protein
MFAFLASFFITFILGFFVWNIFLGSNNYIYIFSQVLGQASLSNSEIKNVILETNSGPDIVPEINNEEEVEASPALQDLLDDIAEKLDIIQQQVNELVAEKNKAQDIAESQDENLEKEAPVEEVKEEKSDEKDIQEKNKVEQGDPVYAKILIFDAQIESVDSEKEEFVKLYNPNDKDVDLTGWYLQKKTATGSDYLTYTPGDLFLGKKILANKYFYICREGYYFNGLCNIFTENSLTENNSLVLKNPNREISDEFLTVAIPLPVTSPVPKLKNILISEIQISPIDQRFVELYNPNDTDIDLTNWYLQRKTATGFDYTSFVSKNNFKDKIILAKSYFLISRTNLLADIFKDNLTLTKDNFFVLKNPNQDIFDEVILIGQNPDEGKSLCRNDFLNLNWEFCLPTPKTKNQKWFDPLVNDSGDYFQDSGDYSIDSGDYF